MQSLPQGSAVSIESLLAHADWVRALARRLVADPNSAEDLEQEVWRTALESPPPDASNPRGWLASVARNAARSLGRANARRKAREQRSAPAEALPATSELVAEAELARELAGEVLELEEPYRTVLLLRFWRSLSPDEIAHAQSISRETVRTQLKRALERLRERLDRRHGGRERWLAALAPLAQDTALPLSGFAAGSLLALALKLGAAAALAAGVWRAWPTRVETVGEHARVETAAYAPPAKLETADSAAPARAPAEPVAAAPDRATAAAASGAAQRLVGAAIDVAGRPVVGLELVWQRTLPRDWPHWEGTHLVLRQTSVEIPARILELLRAHPEEVDKLIADVGDEPGFREVLLGIQEPTPSARTDADGRFEYSLPEGEWELALLDVRRTVIAEISSPRKPEWTLVIAPCVEVAGTVVDESGTAIEQAALSFPISLSSVASFPRPAEVQYEEQQLARTGPDGAFRIERAPIVRGHRLECRASGFETGYGEVAPEGSDSLRIVLKPAHKEKRPVLSGLVLDAQGLAAPGAFVSLGQDGSETDEQGHFAFELTTGRAGTPLTASKPGVQPAVLENFGEDRPVSRSEILLRLGPPALSIRGRVLLRDGGAPKRGHVQVVDGTPYGSYGCYIEDATAGHHMPGVELKRDGTFVLGGLSSRSYRLLAWDEVEGQLVYSDPIAAGTQDVVLQSRAEDFHEQISGRMQTRRGEPVEGVDVEIWMNTFRSPGSGYAKTFGRVSTDAEGRFTLARVPRSWSEISFHGEGVRYESVPVPESASTPLTISVKLEVRTAAEVADESIDSIQFLDAEGKVVSADIQWPGLSSQQDDVRREKTGFPVFKINDEAVTAVLRQGKTEIRRVPVEIRREKMLTLRF